MQTTLVTPGLNQAHRGSSLYNNEDNSRYKSLEPNLLSQNNRLIQLEECCSLLAESTKLQTQLTNMKIPQ